MRLEKGSPDFQTMLSPANQRAYAARRAELTRAETRPQEDQPQPLPTVAEETSRPRKAPQQKQHNQMSKAQVSAALKDQVSLEELAALKKMVQHRRYNAEVDHFKPPQSFDEPVPFPLKNPARNVTRTDGEHEAHTHMPE